MTSTLHRCPDPSATEALGRELAARLAAGDLVLLRGDLAAGKTTLVRGLVDGLGGDPDEVNSPSFVLVQTYPCRRGAVRRLHHVDLYRLDESPRTLAALGLEEMLSDPDAVTAVEWPKTPLADWLPEAGGLWTVTIEVGAEELRTVAVAGPETR